MIFLTTGTQLSFDRLVQAVDEWAEVTPPDHEVFAQVLSPRDNPYRPRNFETRSRLSPVEYAEVFSKARLIISHAGMGTILTALTQGKQICIMPRQAKYGEHRNDHQMATIEQMRDIPGLYTARDEKELRGCLDAAMHADATAQIPRLDPFADAAFGDRLRDFILTGRR